MPERLIKHGLLTKKDVAVFSSWWEIALASEHEEGTIFANTGNMPMHDPLTDQVDSVMGELNAQQEKDLPREKKDRLDPYTGAQALHFFDKYEPRFLWIAFTDADEAAHANNLESYHHILSFYDDFLDRLFNLLITTNRLNDTMVILSTDHGRGNGDKWTSHGPEYPESKRTWAFVVNGELVPDHDNDHYSTLSIRPTIESTLLVNQG